MIFGIIEGVTLGLTTVWFAAGALIAMLAAMLNMPFVGQIFVFLISSSVLLYFTRPIAKDYLKIGTTRTNVNSLIGEIGIVMKDIQRFHNGQVKVNGQIWTAKAIEDEEIKENQRVEIVSVEGVKLIVKAVKQD